MHVSLRAYVLHSMQWPFIKGEVEKLWKVVHTVDKNSPLRRRGSNNNFSCLNLIFFMFLYKKCSCQNFVSHFLLITVIIGHELYELRILTLF